MLVLSRRDYEGKIHNLIRIIRQLQAERVIIVQRMMALEDLVRRQGRREDFLTPAQPDQWKRAWAKEFLRISQEPLTPATIRAARREAIKREHPDAGGTAERMRMIEEAVETLSR